MSEELDQHSRKNGRYQWLPDLVLPKMWCPCGGRMRPTKGDEFPHQFQCDGCYANVDMHPPDQGWEPRRCGGWIEGLRCNQPLGNHKILCPKCQRLAVHALFTFAEGRQFLSDMVGQAEVSRLATEAMRAKDKELAQKREAREAQLRSATGYVVYYARLGNNHIKIGTTVDLPRRMVELRVVNAGNLLAAEPGGFELERKRHQQFRKWRYQRRKEDFGEGPDLLQHIALVREEHGDPYQLAAQLDKIQVDATPFVQADDVSAEPA